MLWKFSGPGRLLRRIFFGVNGWALYDGTILETPPEGATGFVYKITRIADGKFYIGKKQLTFRRTKQVKGKRQRYVIESDWKTYYGSSAELQEDVARLGEDAFHREILHMCQSKSECNYLETFEIFFHSCLLREDCYNSWVSCKIHKKHVLGKL